MSKIMYNGKEYPGSVPYRELQGTLSAGQTSITFTDDIINTGRTIDYFTSIYGVMPVSIVVSSGSIVLTFKTQASDMKVKVRIS